MRFRTRPFLSPDFAPLVEIQCGSERGQITATQAEDLSQALSRAATASRYESGIADYLAKCGDDLQTIQRTIENIRSLMEQRRLSRS